MGKVVVSQFMTVDGVVEDPGGSEKSPYGGWAFQFDRGAEGDQFKFDEVTAAEALLLGRRTYEGFAEAWPSRDGEFADKFNSMPKYVVSSTLTVPMTKRFRGSAMSSGALGLRRHSPSASLVRFGIVGSRDSSPDKKSEK